VCIDKEFAGVLPQIPGVADHNNPPVINLADFNTFGCNSQFRGSRPTYIVNDLVTKVRGSHTFKFGGEYRKLGINQVNRDNGSGTFRFSRLNTGLIGITSGNSIASFILGRVDSASGQFRTVEDYYARADDGSVIQQSRPESVVPTESRQHVPVRLIRPLGCKLRRQVGRRGSGAYARVIRAEEMVFIPEVVVDAHVPEVRVIEELRPAGLSSKMRNILVPPECLCKRS